MATYWVPDLLNIKGISGHLWHSNWCLMCMSQQAYKYLSLSLWPRLTFFELKITNILKSSGWGLERLSCHGNIIFYSRKCVSCRTISLTCFNGLRYKLAKIALFIYLISTSFQGSLIFPPHRARWGGKMRDPGNEVDLI